MAAALAHLEGAEEALGRGGPPEAVGGRLALAAALAREGMSEVRRTVSSLRDEAEEGAGVGLPEALEGSVRLLTAGVPGLAVRLRVRGVPRRLLPPDKGVELLRIAQEAVANAVKHSGARVVEVSLAYGAGGLITLRVADDGQGFDPVTVRSGGCPGHYGLAGMGERAARLGARLCIESSCGRGTRVTVRVPAPAPAEGAPAHCAVAPVRLVPPVFAA
jgi:signal transduction histidine kinase